MVAPDIIVGGSNPRAFVGCKRIVLAVVSRIDPAIVTHLDHPGGPAIFKHGMLAGELPHDPFDC